MRCNNATDRKAKGDANVKDTVSIVAALEGTTSFRSMASEMEMLFELWEIQVMR